MGDGLAFSGAEGFGAETVGGRYGAVIAVTNLNDSGEGSLRWALETAQGPRTVTFAVNGVIHLKDQIVIRDPYVTIAGQTAPGDGITIEGARLHVRTSEVIVRGLKFRPGDSPLGEDPGNRDGLFIGTTDFEVTNVVVDHNSITWGVDENFTISGHVTNVTFSNNIVAEGLSRSIHPEGEHSKGVLVSNWGSLDPAFNSRISIVKNLMAHNFARNPEIKSGQSIEIINNYIYDYGLAHLALAIGGGNNGTLATTLVAIGNVFSPGPSTPNYKMPIAFQVMGSGSAIFLSDNFWTKIPANAAGDQDQSKLVWNNGGLRHLSTAAPFELSDVDVIDSAHLLDYIAANVGASIHDRDATDTRIIASVIDKTGRIIDSVAQVRSSSYSAPVRAASDSDADGMPDWFEDLYAADAGLFLSNDDSDGDGFTNIEEYVNGLITGFDLPVARAMTLVVASEAADLIAADGGSVLTVFGFDYAGGDRIDLASLLAGYDPLTAALDGFVAIDVVAGDTVISVDQDGAGDAFGWEVAAILIGVHGPEGARLLAGDRIVDVAAGETVATGPGYDDIVLHGALATASVEDRPRTDLDAGEGDDRILLSGGATSGAIAGGAGHDSLIVGDPAAADVSGLVVTGIERLETYDVAVRATAEQFAGFDAIMRTADAPSSSVTLALAAAGAVDLATQLAGRSVTFTGSSGADRIVTSDGADLVSGAFGDDELSGGLGADTLFGQDGSDTLKGSDGADQIDGGAGDDSLFGDAGGDLIFGGAGADMLDGGVGNDVLRGGAGADIYYVDSDDDGINERFGQTVDDGAIDLVISFDHRVLTKFVDNLILLGDAKLDGVGNEIANRLDGNAGANHLTGAAGADTLNGADGADSLAGGLGDDRLDGGAGFDVLSGGLDGDVYVLADDDLVVELDGEGVDAVLAYIDYALTDFVEVLNLMGDAGLSGVGNAGANRIVGNVGDDTIDGGAGADDLQGGDGFDIAVYATSAEGIAVDLGAGAGFGGSAEGDVLSGVEALTGSAHADALTGDDGGNALSGGEGDDRLGGGGGADTLSGDGGFDTLVGGTGDDLYRVGDADRVVEDADGGFDTVEASIDYTLSGHLEALRLIGDADLVGAGDATDNALGGNAGDNRLTGGAGADTIDGGEGRDTANYVGSSAAVTVNLATGVGQGGDAAGDRLVGIENLAGSAFADRLTGDDLDNRLVGGLGADVLDGGAGFDIVDYSGTRAAVVVDLAATIEGAARPSGGEAQGDRLIAIENVQGGAFDDKLRGDAGANVFLGGAGADLLDGREGADTLDGGAGNDVYTVDASGDVVVEADLLGGADEVNAFVSFVLGANLERLRLVGADAIDGAGNALANVLTGNDAANALSGLDGRDVLTGGGGDDVLQGGGDKDQLAGGLGADTLLGEAADDRLDGGDGDDALLGGDGADLMYGDAGADALDGGEFKDMLSGGIGDDQLFGAAADDNLLGGDGADVLDGGDGLDKLNGGAGADSMAGGLNDDSYTVDDVADVIHEAANGGGGDRVESSVSYTLSEYVEFLTLTGDAAFGGGNEQINKITGNEGANEIWGAGGADVLVGAGGDDQIDGGLGADKLYGGAGDDVIVAGVGQDLVSGGLGADTLSGGSSRDIFVFAALDDSRVDAHDVIADFDRTDAIDLAAIDAISGAEGKQRFSFIGAADFSEAGQIRYLTDGAGGWFVQADVDGDLQADLAIDIYGDGAALTSGSFLL